MKKKIFIGLGVVFGLLFLAMLILPFVIDVDKYRPDAVALANEKINGHLEMGKFKLSLWGQIRVNIDGIELKDAAQKKILSVKDVYFHVPFSSLLSGSPLFTLKVQKPEIEVIKDKKGKLNVMTLVKQDAQAKTEAPKETTAAPSTPGSSSAPSFVKKTRIGVEIREANVKYMDESTGLTSELKDLNFLVKDFSIERASEMEFWANLDTKMGKSLNVRGLIKAGAKITPEFKGTTFQEAKIDMSASMDDVEISMPDVFQKSKGTPLNMHSKMSVTETSVLIHQLELVFFNAKVEGKASISDFAGDGNVKAEIASNSIELKTWGEVLPSLKKHELSGTTNFKADVNGMISNPRYNFEAFLKDFIAKAPGVKAEPKVQAHIKVVPDRVEDISFSLVAPGSQMSLKATVDSFTTPKVDVRVTSTGLDLDSFMDLKTPAPAKEQDSAKKTEGLTTAQTTEGKSSAPAEAEDLDSSLDSLRKNEFAKKMVVNMSAKFAFIKAYETKLTDLNAEARFQSLAFTVSKASFKLWDGSLNAKMSTELMPKIPTYKFEGQVTGVNIQKAVESQFALFKNTLLGIANFSINGSGSSFVTPKAKKNLVANGKYSVSNATFATIDIAKVVGEGLNKIVGSVGDKIPAIKDKKINVSDNTQSKYSSVTSDFSIQNGIFTMPNFVGTAEVNKGIDIKGDTTVGLLDNGLKSNWELIDTYNVTKAKDLSVEQNGVRVEHILAEGNQPVKLPITIEGKTSDPKVSYEKAVVALSNVAVKNVGNALVEKAKGEARKQAEDAAAKAVKQASPQVQDAIKNLGGKLFGN